MTRPAVVVPLVLDAYQMGLLQAWQQHTETAGPVLYAAALRAHRVVRAAELPLERLTGAALVGVLREFGHAAVGADALLVVWHDAQLHGALGQDCPWPGRLAALRADRCAVAVDYYPSVVDGAGALRTARWSVDGAVRDPHPALPVPMLDLLAVWRPRRRRTGRGWVAGRRLRSLGVLADLPVTRGASRDCEVRG